VVEDFLEFVGGAVLVAHNASFDMRFMNAELAALDRPNLPKDKVLDTIALARRKLPGGQYSLNALCRRFDIDLSDREKHGALLDAELLADVYLELIGGRQPGLVLASENKGTASMEAADRGARTPRPHAPPVEEETAHRAFVAKMDDPIWNK
jgi:DNA polymerase-3 subunit epsilon